MAGAAERQTEDEQVAESADDAHRSGKHKKQPKRPKRPAWQVDFMEKGAVRDATELCMLVANQKGLVANLCGIMLKHSHEACFTHLLLDIVNVAVSKRKHQKRHRHRGGEAMKTLCESLSPSVVAMDDFRSGT